MTIHPGFSGTVRIFGDVSQKKITVLRDAHLSCFWLGVPNLSRHWQTALFHHTNTNTYLLESDFICIMYIRKNHWRPGLHPELRAPLGELTMLPRPSSWIPNSSRVWRSHPTTHAFGAHPVLRCLNYGHLRLGHWCYCTYLLCDERGTEIARVGSVWIFNFGSIWFGFQSQVISFGFFGFDIRTPPQCKSILVYENSKAESINFHKKFQLKYIDWPRRVWRSYSFTLGVVGLSQQSALQ